MGALSAQQAHLDACLDVAKLLTLIHARSRDQYPSLHMLRHLTNQSLRFSTCFICLAVDRQQELKGATCTKPASHHNTVQTQETVLLVYHEFSPVNFVRNWGWRAYWTKFVEDTHAVSASSDVQRWTYNGSNGRVLTNAEIIWFKLTSPDSVQSNGGELPGAVAFDCCLTHHIPTNMG